MREGYVLDFSNDSFQDFFYNYKIDIYSERYNISGGSKARRLRAFWDLESNGLVAHVISGLIDYGESLRLFSKINPEFVDDCRSISKRYLSGYTVNEVDSLVAITDEQEFEILAAQAREVIDKNQPEAGLDRLHTYTQKFVRSLLETHGVSVEATKPLHSKFGEYTKVLKKGGYLESLMAERILKSGISIMDAFNEVRNNKSFAHDNKILSYEEGLLIFNYVASVIRFVRKLEEQIKSKTATGTEEGDLDDIPF